MRDWNELYTRYLNKQCSEEEVRMLLEHFRLEGAASELLSRIQTELARTNIPERDTPEVSAAFRRIHHQLTKQINSETDESPKVRRFRWIPYAAAVILAVGVGMLGLEYGQRNQQHFFDATDIGPGGNKATLTLADGRIVNLSPGHDGIIVGDEVTYGDGRLVVGFDSGITAGEAKGTGNIQLLLLTTPRGGTYKVVLSDGTKVWLNSASTLRYPSRFVGNERVVELEGEAYFEVSKQTQQTTNDLAMQTKPTQSQNMPFRVKSKGQTVEVLGTQFNVSAYPDDREMKTTLVEGHVRVMLASDSKSSFSLRPGQQTIVRGSAVDIQHVDVTTFVAWKEGLFSFNETELQTVMNQLSRWYDVEINYHGDIPPTYYYGAISRNENLASVLNLLKESGLNFKVAKENGTNKLVVLP